MAARETKKKKKTKQNTVDRVRTGQKRDWAKNQRIKIISLLYRSTIRERVLRDRDRDVRPSVRRSRRVHARSTNARGERRLLRTARQDVQAYYHYYYRGCCRSRCYYYYQCCIRPCARVRACVQCENAGAR